MWIRDGFWIGGILVVTAIGAVAAYSAVDPLFLSRLRGASVSSAVSAGPVSEPVRRTARIDGDMTATFERLEKSGSAASRPVLAAPAAVPARDRSEDAARRPAASGEAVAATPSAGWTSPVPLTAPTKGMPVSLVPTQRPASGDAPRVMDPRLTRTLDLLGSAAPRAIVAAVPEAMPSSTAPSSIVVSTDAAVPPIAASPAMLQIATPTPTIVANESDMTAEELNAREHQRIRRTLEGRAGGTN